MAITTMRSEVNCLVLGVALSVGAAVGWFGARYRSKDRDVIQEDVVAQLQAEVDRQKQLRAQERTGRIHRERDAREKLQRQQEQDGFPFTSIGHVESCYRDRRGTPRQGTLVPSARARIQFSSRISPEALAELQQFSHLWVLFVFHENTNAPKALGAASNASNDRAAALTTFPAKIAPPRLGGKKVGVFSTRSPHRPNSIGLSVVQIVKVEGRSITISAHDMVEGTPVLDVKPYVPMDCIQDYVCPPWVGDDTKAIVRPVEFAANAVEELDLLVQKKQLRFYTTLDEIQNAIIDTLKLDIRGVHQGRGHANALQVFMCRLDNVEIQFQTLESHIRVVKCSHCPH